MKKETPDLLKKYFFYSLIDWDKLPANEREELESSKTTIRLRKNEILYEEDSRPRGAYVVVKGKVKIFQRLDDGRQQILFIYVEKEVFGFRPLLCDEVHPTSAAAMEPTLIEFIPSDVFLRVIRNSTTLSNMLLINLSREFIVWMHRIIMFARKDVRQRLALVLLIFNEKFKSPNSKIETSSIKLSRTDLAASIGVSLETLVRTLKKFSEEKLIRVHGKTIIITNVRKMISEAGI